LAEMRCPPHRFSMTCLRNALNSRDVHRMAKTLLVNTAAEETHLDK
jgi:hypothetical protein